MVAHSSQTVSVEQQLPDSFVKNGQPTSASTTLDKNITTLDEDEIKAAKIQAKAARCAAYISAVGAFVAGVVVFSATQYYQENDGRQKALNDYTNSMKELLASTNIDRKAPQKIAALQYAKTLLAMRELDGDGDRKGQALRFLYDTCLVIKQETLCHVNVPAEGRLELNGTNLDGITLKDAWMPDINLRGVYMRGSDLQKANLEGADLIGTHMEPNPKSGFLRFLPFIGSWFHQKSDLRWANLRGADLQEANLQEANLQEADLHGTDLRFVNLNNVNLTGANLTSACYVEGTEAKYFPPNFQPAAHGMRAIPEDKSDPSKPNFQPCAAP